jgi:uncharacterized membrane protein
MAAKKASKKSKAKSSSSAAEDGKVCAVLQYIFPIGLIWWLVDEKMKKNPFATFHMKESIALVIVAVVINIVGSIIPVLGWFVILPLGGLFVFVLWIIGIYKAATGEQKSLPLTGKLAEKF